jgi:hypothetical protein
MGTQTKKRRRRPKERIKRGESWEQQLMMK